MQKSLFRGKNLVRLLATALLIGIALLTVYYAVGYLSGTPTTVRAKEITDVKTVVGQAWLFQNVQTVPGEGVVNPLIEDGAEVKNGTPVAEVWTGLPQGMTLTECQNELDTLNASIALLRAGLSTDDTNVAQCRLNVLSDFAKIRLAVRNGKWSEISDLEENILICLNQYSAFNGNESELNQSLNAMLARKAELLCGVSTTLSWNGEDACFFGRLSLDGLESVFSTDAVQNMTLETFHTLCQSQPLQTSSLVGKSVSDKTWYLTVEVQSSKAQDFSLGENYTVTFPENKDFSLKMNCEKIIIGDETSLIVLKSSEIPAGFRFLRRQDVTITVKEFTGINIPESAIVRQGDVEGVYILNGNKANFRRVDFIFQGDGYRIGLVSEQVPVGKNAYLILNDEVIVSGKNIFEGKKYR